MSRAKGRERRSAKVLARELDTFQSERERMESDLARFLEDGGEVREVPPQRDGRGQTAGTGGTNGLRTNNAQSRRAARQGGDRRRR